MSLIQVRCKDCAGYGRETWFTEAELPVLTEDELDGAFYWVILQHHRETHILNTQNSKADGGDNCYAFFAGAALIGYAAVSSDSRNFWLKQS
jgi:hypothetical protein